MELQGSSQISTTNYHPSNGLVECFHQQLKGALKTQPQPNHWSDSIPLILLGIQAAIRQDLGCSSAELVYSTTLCLPGSFFNHVNISYQTMYKNSDLHHL